MRVDAKRYSDEGALNALGAQTIAHITDETGALIAYEVEPDINLGGYTSAHQSLISAALVSYAETKHAALKTGGFSFNLGTKSKPQIAFASTADGARTDLNGLVSLAQMDETFSTIWMNQSGTMTLTAPQIIALGKAVGTFVVATYPALAAVLSGIADGSITTTKQIDAAVWPANNG